MNLRRAGGALAVVVAVVGLWAGDGNGLAVAALVVAGVAVVLSIVSLVTRRSRPTS